jgi:uncharacterized protein (DUF427 family)
VSRIVKQPDSQHPITIEPTGSRVVVRVGSTVVADTTAALTLREASYAPVQYIPLADVDPSVLRSSPTQTYCPFKGDAGYYSLVTAAGEVADAVWTYRQPYPAVAVIAGRVAFYPQHVSIEIAHERVA